MIEFKINNFFAVNLLILLIQLLFGLLGLNDILIMKYQLPYEIKSYLNIYNMMLVLIALMLYVNSKNIIIFVNQQYLNILLLSSIFLILYVVVSEGISSERAITRVSIIGAITVYTVLLTSLLITCTASKVSTLCIFLTIVFFYMCIMTGRRGVVIFPLIAVSIGLSNLFGAMHIYKRVIVAIAAFLVLIFGRNNSIAAWTITSFLEGVSTFDGYPFSVLAFLGNGFMADQFGDPERGYGLGVDGFYIAWSFLGPLIGTVTMIFLTMIYAVYLKNLNKIHGQRYQCLVMGILIISYIPFKNYTLLGTINAPIIIAILSIIFYSFIKKAYRRRI